MSQTVYNRLTEIALAGNLFGRRHSIETIFLETGTMPFGYGVVKGTGEQDGILQDGSAPAIADIRGVAIRNPNIVRIWKSTDDPTYTAENDDVMDVVRKGMIWVATTSTLIRGGPIFMQHTTSGMNYAGTFRNTIDGAAALDVSEIFSVFRGNENPGEVAVLEVHITS